MPLAPIFVAIFVMAAFVAVGLWYLLLFLLAGIWVLVVWFSSKRVNKGEVSRVSDFYAEKLDFLAKNLPLSNSSALALRGGEEFVYQLEDGALIESRKAPRVTQRSGGAVTFALAKGLYYTGARGSSVSPEPEDEMRTIDQGSVTFTTQRVVFVGSKQSREWDFSKMLGWNEGTGFSVTIAVSNRQKVSGIEVSGNTDIGPGALMQICETVRESGWDAAREICANTAQQKSDLANYVRENPKATKKELVAYEQYLYELNSAEESETENERSSETGSPRALTKAPLPQQSKVEQLETLSEIGVVGEMFYKKSFEALRHEFKSEGNTEHVVEVELRNDPDNEYSESGKAVAVFIRNKKVGHVPEWLAPKVFDQLEPEGGTVTLGARLYLDYVDAKPQKNSVTVTLDSRLVVK